MLCRLCYYVARATRKATEGRVIYPTVVEGGIEPVQEKSDGKENLQELAAIVASSATAAAIAASQRLTEKVSSPSLLHATKSYTFNQYTPHLYIH